MCFLSQRRTKARIFHFPSENRSHISCLLQNVNYSTNEMTKQNFFLEKMSIFIVKLAYREGQLQLFPNKGTLSQTIASTELGYD
jgi:hypothetical protein